MKEMVQAVAQRLQPPPIDADPKSVMAWRWFVAITAGVNALALATHIALACGLLVSATGYSGFASATDVEKMKLASADQRTRELSKEMLDAKQKQCTAPPGDVKRLYLQSYNDLRAEYFQLTRREFPELDCRDF